MGAGPARTDSPEYIQSRSKMLELVKQSPVVSGFLVVDAAGRGSRSLAWLESLGYQRQYKKTGEMPERLKGHDWKSCEGLISLPRVRIPLSPPFFRVFGFQFSVFGKPARYGGWGSTHLPELWCI